MSINLSLYRDDWTRKCLSVASYTCLVYDHTLTFDREVEFIWQAPWTFTKAGFLFNRYGNLICQTVIHLVRLVEAANHSPEFCDLPVPFTVTYSISAMESTHILVLLRAWAIWGCQRRVAIMLMGSYSIYLIGFLIKSTFGAMSITIRTFKYANLPEICVVVVPPGAWILCFVKVCQDTVVFVITMVSLWRHSRNAKLLYPTSLLFLLVRDAAIFYIVCIFFHVFNAVICILYPSNPKNDLCMTFSLNLLTIAGQRLVLNLRGFTVRTYGTRSLSAEVDRQLQALSGTKQLEWWSSSMSQPEGSRMVNRKKPGGDIETGTLGYDSPNRQSDGVAEVITPTTSREENLTIE